MQLQAGYFLPTVKQQLVQTGNHIDDIDYKINGLLTHLCYFELETNANLSSQRLNVEPLIAVANNIVSRGLPTQPSTYIEAVFSETFQLTERYVDELGTIHYRWIHQTVPFDSLYAALHIIEPRLNCFNRLLNTLNSWEQLGSQYEEDFLYQAIPNHIGDYFIQLLEPQRLFTSIISQRTDFTEQQVDFAVEFPYAIAGKKGLIIEIDGPQHERDQQQIHLDRQRDISVENIGWAKTLRIKTGQFDNIGSKLYRVKKMVKNPYFKILADNYQQPWYQTEPGLDALQLALTPIAIARIQKTLLELMLSGYLDLTAPVWRMVVIERDVPCAFLAIEDFKRLFQHLFLLKGEGRQLPHIELQIFVSPEFKNAKLNQCHPVKTLTEINDNISCDVLLDISMLQRVGFTDRDTRIHYQYFATIRSAHAPISTRFFYTADLIQFRQVAQKRDNETYAIIPEAEQSLTYFLQNIFRKAKFRQGQLEILNRALQRQSVIGLLPTGGGKSLTYQLAVCLQPGLALIIDPITSLMQDQYDNLLKNHIDACIFINSSLNQPQKMRATEKLSQAEVLFTFISPERLQIQSFRDVLTRMSHQANYFSYCVIDEVHCVSEWGHDFRTAYLKLGKNVIQFCKTKNTETIPLFGLTATASFDVLADVQRELSANHKNRLGEDAIVRFETTNREELQFEIIKVEADNIASTKTMDIKGNIGLAKQAQLHELLMRVADKIHQYNLMSDNQHIALANFDPKHFFNQDCIHAGLIFCPHRSWYFGVTDKYKKSNRKLNGVYDSLTNLPHLQIGTFLGSDNNKTIETDSIRHQADFINNRLNLLVATKAFGMGIDKPNIRFTVHINYPSSIESFVQEAGRAGRDRKLAICYILFNDQAVTTQRGVIEADQDILYHFHRRAFKGENPEKSLLYHHFLNTIIYQSENRLKIIAKQLAKVFNLKVSLRIWNNCRLYINEEFQKKNYGYLMLPNLKLKIDTKSGYNHELSDNILRFVKSSIKAECPPEENLLNWLQTALPSESVPGIEKQLAAKKVGEKLAPIVVPFLEDDDKADKEKAIYRLSTLGVVDDYTIDFNAKTFVLEVTKKADDTYKEYLRNYIKTYYSDVKANEAIAPVDSYKGETTLQKCLGFLIDFVYREIVKKRFEAINTMKMACYEGLKENGNQPFKEFVDLYFNAKYARKNYRINEVNYSLTDWTDEGKNQNLQWVWEFITVVNIDKTGSQLDNLKHLRGAGLRLLIDNPDNACLLLLKAFALFILAADNENLLKEAKDSFIKGFLRFQASGQLSVSEYMAGIFRYNAELEKYHLASKQIIDNEIHFLSLNVHTNWLEKFNHRFLENYESLYSR